MISRRNALQFAAAIAAGKITLPKAVGASPIFDIAQFPIDLSEHYMYGSKLAEVEGTDLIAPAAKTAFDQAYHALMQALPELATAPSNHPIHQFQEAGVWWAVSSYDAGLTHGAQIEALRSSIIGPLGECPVCWGWGLLMDTPRDGHSRMPLRGEAAHPCHECNGTGSIPVARVDELKRQRALRDAA